MTIEEMKAWLKEKLGREITISQVTVDGQPKFLVDYVNHSAPATKLVGDTEDQAITNLFNYLYTVTTVSDVLNNNFVGETKE